MIFRLASFCIAMSPSMHINERRTQHVPTPCSTFHRIFVSNTKGLLFCRASFSHLFRQITSPNTTLVRAPCREMTVLRYATVYIYTITESVPQRRGNISRSFSSSVFNTRQLDKPPSGIYLVKATHGPWDINTQQIGNISPFDSAVKWLILNAKMRH